MPPPTVVAYDVGTSGVKAVVLDERGRVLVSHVETLGIETPRPGWVEQDIDALCGALGRASRRVMTSRGIDPAAVAVATVTAQMFSVVPVDRDGRAVRPMLSWLDQRSQAAAVEITKQAGTDDGYPIFDAVLSGKDIVPKIAWLRAHEPDPKTVWYLDCKEAIVARLSGAIAIDPCGASAYRLIDRATGTWDAAACTLAGIPVERLPPIRPATAIAGRLTREAAEATGLPIATPVIVGTGDVAASQIGAGAHGPGDAHLSLGTAAYLGITTDRSITDPRRRLGPLRHALPDRWIVWLETATGGGALSWLRRTLEVAAPGSVLEHERLDRLVEEAAGEMEDLLFAPWLTGERVPLFDDAIRGAFVGLALHHGPGHLARAVMEGVACQIATAFEYGLGYGVSPERVRAVGGGGMGATWTGIVADTLGRPLEIVADPQDAAARGVAACGFVGMGIASEVAEAVPTSVVRTVNPDPARSAAARARLARFRALHPALRTLADGPPPRSSRP